MLPCTSLLHLLRLQPRPGQVTHVFIDPWVIRPTDPRHQLFKAFKEYNDRCGLKIHFLYYKYLYLKLRQVYLTDNFTFIDPD